MYHKVPNSVK
jgi:hypothetical protein